MTVTDFTATTLAATSITGDHTLRVTEFAPGRSSITRRFTLSSRYTEGQAHAAAYNSFDLEDINVVLVRETENDKWDVTVRFQFAGNAEKAWEFAQGSFIGTPDYCQLMWELGERTSR